MVKQKILHIDELVENIQKTSQEIVDIWENHDMKGPLPDISSQLTEIDARLSDLLKIYKNR